jgi:hypothetical protein
MAPVFQAAGTAQSGINALTVAWPSHLTNDIGILVIETGGEGATLSITAPTGWVAITGSPVTDVATTAGSKLQVWWKRAASAAETSVTVPDSGDHQVAMIYTFRGCITTGNPWDVATTGNKTTASTTATVPSLTTTVQDTLLVAIIGRPDDSASTTHFGTLTNANLTGIASAGEAGTQSGHGGGFVLEYGAFLGPGSTGTSTATKTASTTDTYMALALRAPLRALSLVSDVGAFALTGRAANLLENRRLVADKGTLTETGIAAGLARGFRLTADKGTFTETGRDANLTRTRLLLASAGAVTLSGKDATPKAGRLLTGDFAKYFLPERNLVKWSEDLANAAWTKTNASVDTNLVTAPDGTLTASKLVESATSGFHQCSQSYTAKAGTAFALSLYAKAGERPRVRIAGASSGNWATFPQGTFDLSAGTIVSSSGSQTATITSVGSGWYRCCIYGVTVSAGSPGVGLLSGPVPSGATNNSYTGDGASGIYIWGAQLEEASAATAYDPTGPAAAAITNTRVTRRLVADPGSLTLTGRDAGVVYASSKKIVADAGAFTCAGQPAALRKTELLIGAAGSFTLTGNTANLARGARLIAAAGAFAETGQPATLRATRRLLSAAGAFTLSGQSAGFLGQRYLPLAPGAFTATGNAATLRVTRSLAAATGSIALTGNAATLDKTAARSITAQPGAFTLSGQPAALRSTHTLTAAAGALALTGRAATLRRAAKLTAAVGAFTAAGQGAALSTGRRLTAAAGAFTLIGQPATPRRAITLVASAGAVTVTGAAASLRRTVRLAAAPATCVISGKSAGFLGQRYLPLAPGALVLTGQAADLRFNRSLQGGSATFLATGPPAVLTPTFNRRRVLIF